MGRFPVLIVSEGRGEREKGKTQARGWRGIEEEREDRKREKELENEKGKKRWI